MHLWWRDSVGRGRCVVGVGSFREGFFNERKLEELGGLSWMESKESEF